MGAVPTVRCVMAGPMTPESADVKALLDDFMEDNEAPDGSTPRRGLTIAEVADFVRVPVAILRYWRHLGTGPHSFRIGRGVRYWRSEVRAWLHGQSDGPNVA